MSISSDLSTVLTGKPGDNSLPQAYQLLHSGISLQLNVYLLSVPE